MQIDLNIHNILGIAAGFIDSRHTACGTVITGLSALFLEEEKYNDIRGFHTVTSIAAALSEFQICKREDHSPYKCAVFNGAMIALSHFTTDLINHLSEYQNKAWEYLPYEDDSNDASTNDFHNEL